MESLGDIGSVVLLLLALGTGCIAKPGCQGKSDVTCPAGSFYISGSCKCEDCPENTFSSKTGTRSLACSRCKLCEGIFRYKVKCSRMQDAQCECKPGFRCAGTECAVCYKNCERGEEPTENGCQKCPQDTFNNETNGPCKPWTNCLSRGLGVLVNGSSSSDAVCSPPVVTVVIPVAGVSEDKSIAYPVIIAGSVFFFMCVVCPFMVMVAWVKKKVKNGFKQIPAQIVKTAEAEDGCSCHYPEEEVGSPVTQDP